MALWTCLVPVQTQAMEDAILAVVNNEIITVKDLREYLASVYLQLSASGKSEEEIQEIITEYEKGGLDRLIDDKLIITEADRRGVEIRAEAIDEKIAEVKDKFNSEKTFFQALEADGMNITQLRDKFADQLKAKFLIEKEVRSKIFVNPQEVTEYYQTHKDEFVKPDRLDLASIFIPFADDAQAARQTAQAALEAVRGGRDFASVREEYSQSSDLGLVVKGQLLPEIEEEVFALDKGEVSDSVETGSGIYIFKVKDILPAEQATLEEVKDYIYNKVFDIKYREKLRTWLSELKEDAFIDIKQRP